MTIQDRLTIGACLARRLFPDFGDKIDIMLNWDGNFRDMCEELADLTCAILEGSPYDNVLADWIAARDRLTEEMADALSRANVIPIEQGHRAPRG
jgi:hypothetical protein